MPRQTETLPLQHHCPECGKWYDCELGEDCTLIGQVELVCSDCEPEHHATEMTTE